MKKKLIILGLIVFFVYAVDYHKGSLIVESNDFLFVGQNGGVKILIDTAGFIRNSKPHAWGQFSDSAVTISLTQNNWVHITNSTKTLFPATDYENITDLNDTLKFSYSGDVNCDYNVTFEGTSTDEFEFRVVKNGTQAYKVHYDVPTSANEVNIAIPSAFHPNLNDKVWLEVRNTSNNNDITIISGSIRVRYDYLHINQ